MFPLNNNDGEEENEKDDKNNNKNKNDENKNIYWSYFKLNSSLINYFTNKGKKANYKNKKFNSIRVFNFYLKKRFKYKLPRFN